MGVIVRIPTQLRPLTEGRGEIDADGSSVHDIIRDVEARHPGLAARLLDESGELRRFVNIYVDNEDVRFLQGLSTEVSTDAQISIIPAIAGG